MTRWAGCVTLRNGGRALLVIVQLEKSSKLGVLLDRFAC